MSVLFTVQFYYNNFILLVVNPCVGLIQGLRDSPMRIVFWMASCDFMMALWVTVVALKTFKDTNKGEDDTLATNSFYCGWSVIWRAFWGPACVFWYIMICTNLYCVLKDYTAGYIKRLSFFQHIFVWSYSALYMLLAITRQKYTLIDYGHYCWYADPRDSMNILFFLPMVVGVLFGAFLLVKILNNYCRNRYLHANRKLKMVLLRLFFLTLGFVLVWVWPAIYRMASAIVDSNQGLLRRHKENDNTNSST